jgi:hypothetical protein
VEVNDWLWVSNRAANTVSVVATLPSAGYPATSRMGWRRWRGADAVATRSEQA